MALKTTLNKSRIIKMLEEESKSIKKYGVAKLGLFGSVVRGEVTGSSDLDFLVEFEDGKKTYDNFIQLAFLLEDIFNREVDLVTRQAVAEWMLPIIDKEIEYVEFNR